jgi:hypothetical protein
MALAADPISVLTKSGIAFFVRVALWAMGLSCIPLPHDRTSSNILLVRDGFEMRRTETGWCSTQMIEFESRRHRSAHDFISDLVRSYGFPVAFKSSVSALVRFSFPQHARIFGPVLSGVENESLEK